MRTCLEKLTLLSRFSCSGNCWVSDVWGLCVLERLGRSFLARTVVSI